MSQFTLNTTFTSIQLETLYATGTNVVVAKPASGENPQVAWQVFRPLQANTLTWEEEYGLYASTSSITNGAKLNQLSSVPVGAAMNKLYTMEDSGVISGPASGGSANAFALQNKYSAIPFLTMGLFQNANVNGTEILGNAISAAPVILQSTAVITPYTTVYIWLQSQVLSNSVVTVVTSPMTSLTFGGGISNISVSYDSASGNFLTTTPGNLTRANTDAVLQLEPSL